MDLEKTGNWLVYASVRPLTASFRGYSLLTLEANVPVISNGQTLQCVPRLDIHMYAARSRVRGIKREEDKGAAISGPSKSLCRVREKGEE